ncbi:hypothetical protein AMELA_G00099160 [Ameiurus melas]|uniref:Immunoglobulin V-set domain-containing protein n=1 Tax=Ameiurus melas TaxID=219545 RepID=A0A7J6AW61_AMEME|nr:hypothetical protein AMELA_G00099160 [Ameiurus melas]
MEMRCGSLFLLVVISALQLVSAGDDPVVHNVQGIVGGSVKIKCELQHSHIVNGLYFQKTVNGQEVFINGFYSKEVPVPDEYKNRTTVNKMDLSVEMFELSPADEGEYTCITFSSNDSYKKEIKFHLTVTANYSIPIITRQGCSSDPADHNCVIRCSSSGGYPRSNVTWGVVGADKSEGDPVFTQDRDSLLWNVSHVVTLNCSRMLNITCSIGGVVSHGLSVCDIPATPDIITPIAGVVLLLVPITLLVIAMIKCRRRQPSAELSTDAELASLNSGQAG